MSSIKAARTKLQYGSRAVTPAPPCRSTVGCPAQNALRRWIIKREQPVLGSPEISFLLLASQSFIHSPNKTWDSSEALQPLLIYVLSPDLFKIASDRYCLTCTPVLCGGKSIWTGAAGSGRRKSVPSGDCKVIYMLLLQNCEENQACLWEQEWTWRVHPDFHFLLVLHRGYDKCGYGSSFRVSYSTRLPQMTHYCHHPLIPLIVQSIKYPHPVWCLPSLCFFTPVCIQNL